MATSVPLSSRAEAQQRAAVARSQQISAGIRQIGANATARMNSIQQANDAQHAGYYAQQDSNARNGQGFSNYLLDQTVPLFSAGTPPRAAGPDRLT